MPAASAPDWFISGSDLASVGEKRQQEARASSLTTLAQIFPEASEAELRQAVDAGGDLTTIVDRLLAAQFADEVQISGSSSTGAGPSYSADNAASSGPKRRVRFGPSQSFEPPPSPFAGGSGGSKANVAPMEQMEPMAYDAPAKFGNAGDRFGGDAAWSSGGSGGSSGSGGGSSSSSSCGGGSMSRLSDEELGESLASSGITAEPSPGSARNAARAATAADGTALESMLASGGMETLRTQPMADLASGALSVSARIIKTANELESGYMSEKIVTRFIVEVRQIGIRWEVSRRYSEFHKFHELLSLQWADLPPFPPKLLFSQEFADVAQRMTELDTYLRALLASPAVALSPLVCTFLDAIDVQSFRAQMLPRLQQMSAEQEGQERPSPMIPDHEEAPNGW